MTGFDRYLKNPVILFGHQLRALPIGQAINPRVEGGVLRMTVRFASKQANPRAENVFQLVKEKVLRAMSIGFKPKEVRREMRDDREVFVLSENELMEASIVPIPSNPNALSEMKAKAKKSYSAPKIRLTQHGQENNPAPRGNGEIEMNEADFKVLQEKFVTIETKVKDLEDHNGKLTAELTAQKELYVALEETYKTEKSRANEAELSNIERDIDALIGKKIAPIEKASLLKMAGILSRDDFKEHMKSLVARPDMNLTVGTVLPEDATKSTLPKPNIQPGDKFAELVTRNAGL